MSTQHVIPEIEKKDVGQSVPPSPPSQYPQLPPPRPDGNRWTWIAIVAVALVLVLSLGTLLYVQVGRPGGQPTPTPSGIASPTQPGASTPKATQPAVTPQPTQPSATQVPGNGTTPAPTAEVKWGPQACTAGAKDPTRWASLIGIKGSSMKIENISCANVIGDPSLQAMVTVRHTDALRTLDVYAFDRIISTHPVRLFKLTGLTLGDAKISSYNTILTAEADLSSPLNKGRSEMRLTKDLFREFAWRSDQQALTQVAFPGFFPDLTRYQAEQDQRAIDASAAWKYDAAQVAQHMAVHMLAWPDDTQAKVLSGGSAKDVDTVVLLTSSRGKPTIKVTLSRLEGNVHNMWVVISAQTPGMTITSPQGRSVLSSPVKVTGSGSANEGQVGMLHVLDHLYNKIGSVEARGAQGWGPTSFTATLSYSSTSSPSAQEGVLVLSSSSAADGKINGVVMFKELIG